MGMRSSKPYLIRALYQWIVDSSCTPHLLVDARYPAVQVPRHLVNPDGSIVLDVSPDAIRNFTVADDGISFLASFSSQIHEIFIPNAAVKSIYAKENEEGMFFDTENENPEEDNQGENDADDLHFVQ